MAAQNDQYTLLVVEDENGLRRSIADYFIDSGFRVVEAVSGNHGHAEFRTHRPDLVFTDLCMPDGNGLDLIATLHAESPLTPIIVISGAGMVADAVKAMKYGASDYLCKPVRDMSALESLALQAIERYRSQIQGKAMGEDPLTGLPDRTQLDSLLGQVGASDGGVTLVLVDLDGFKAVKDAFGHALADRLLLEVGERLSLHVGRQEALLHLGGDEFALLLATTDAASLELRVAAIQEGIMEPHAVGEEELTVTASAGLALFPHDGNSGEELLKHAATALYAAKRSGKNQVRRYCSTIRDQSERLSLQAKLRRAFAEREFSMLYQPQFDLASGTIHGVEALLRWQPRIGHLVSPGLFIPALEESGLIVPVGEWILWKACAQYGEWQSLGAPPCMMSVNVSAVQFHASGFVEMVRKVLQDTAMPPERLCLELTESVVMRDGDETINTLQNLKALGVALSLDDFGTGYSSLNYLSRMPLDELKIDRSFVASLPASTSNATIVNTIISMAASMGLRVVAEGIEMAEQAEFFRGRRCQVVQGFYFSRPLPPLGVIDVFGRKSQPQ